MTDVHNKYMPSADEMRRTSLAHEFNMDRMRMSPPDDLKGEIALYVEAIQAIEAGREPLAMQQLRPIAAMVPAIGLVVDAYDQSPNSFVDYVRPNIGRAYLVLKERGQESFVTDLIGPVTEADVRIASGGKPTPQPQ